MIKLEVYTKFMTRQFLAEVHSTIKVLGYSEAPNKNLGGDYWMLHGNLVGLI